MVNKREIKEAYHTNPLFAIIARPSARPQTEAPGPAQRHSENCGQKGQTEDVNLMFPV